MYRLAWPLRFVAIILAGALLLTGVVLGVAPRLWQIANAHEEVPVELPEFQSLSQRTLVYDANDTVIAVFERENSQPIKLSQVPQPVIAALLAVEDTEFYRHRGVNLRGFARALLSNFSSEAPLQGASTITQQVVKNEFLAGLPRDGAYKLKQAHFATMLEKKMSKDDILERYLNTVFYGNNAYGLQAAAEVYFGKNVEELTLVEGAFLAGLVRSPSGYDPIRNPEPSRRRFAQVVERLVDQGLVTGFHGEYLIANWEIPFRLRTIPTFDTTPTYFTVALREYLLTRSTILGATEQERANLLYRGGLRIYTTLDPTMQAAAENARNILPNSSKGFDAAIVAVDTTTGAIRAMVGGRGLRPDEPGGEVNMALVPRQTGSSTKAFILAAAYQAGVQPTDTVNGIKGCKVPDFVDGRPSSKVINSGDTGIGPIRGRTIWSSSDCGFVRLSYAVGQHRVVDMTYRLAHSAYFYQGQPAADHEPFEPLGVLATGNNPLSTLDMATGMQTILNKGLHHDPYYVEYITRADGSRFFTRTLAGVQVLDEGVALQTVDSLKGVITSGTGARNLWCSAPVARPCTRLSRPAAGKTGTQFENTNAWFVGGTPQIAAAVWVGDPDGYTPMNGIPEFAAEMGRNGKVQGADYPARIWGAFIEGAHAGLPVEDWPAPPPPTRRSARIYVPGEECLARLVSGTLPGASTTTTVATTPPSTNPGDPPPPVTTAPRAVVVQVPPGTTVPLEVLDPRAPVPSVLNDGKTFVYVCDAPPPNVVVQPDD
ncbi:MAG TPA: hypothetical protein DCR14_06105 [Acidimicrobiaceae bacterium]|nr:hypothetical protein [Acidimicrobiaceae bacterium]